ncbi:zinc-ribbon domain-containing protein, partial [Lactobacillus delbrueckii]|uniref:zinc-ribbon domain-containing protein n=1 Tax=Lactobacillus delbrueckii TaxID=1584 RepID=UPI00228533D9
GSKNDLIYCANCGAKNQANATFCANCGAKLVKPAQSSQPTQLSKFNPLSQLKQAKGGPTSSRSGSGRTTLTTSLKTSFL